IRHHPSPWRSGEHAKGNPRQGHVAIAAPVREISDAQLFAQSAHAPGQTDQRSQLLHCQTDLTAPAIAMMPVFHGVSVAVGMPVARHPPHRSVRALQTHTVLTSDVLTQSVPPDTDAGSRLPV